MNVDKNTYIYIYIILIYVSSHLTLRHEVRLDFGQVSVQHRNQVLRVSISQIRRHRIHPNQSYQFGDN